MEPLPRREVSSNGMLDHSTNMHVHVCTLQPEQVRCRLCPALCQRAYSVRQDQVSAMQPNVFTRLS